MKNSDNTSTRYGEEADRALNEIVRVSRALGVDPFFVLHGGGNTSIKTRGRDVTGECINLIFVKGSGTDLGTIHPKGFAPLRCDRLAGLIALEELDDLMMVNELRQASLDANAPTASIETLLHAILPGRVVLHSHADAVVALTNRDVPDHELIDVLGGGVLVLPYIMPGFSLARTMATTDLTGADSIVLRNHGLFTFGEDPEFTLVRHRELVARAADASGIRQVIAVSDARPGNVPELIAQTRSDISKAAGRPMIVHQSESRHGAEFAKRGDLEEVTRRGTATPEHVRYTKREPLLGRNVGAYVGRYRDYFERHMDRVNMPVLSLDPAPRVILDQELGLLSAGDTVGAAKITEDIALHTINIIEAADRLGGYRSLDESSTFDVEYWPLEQAKLARYTSPALGGEIALVTGAASGIGRAVASSLLEAGAAVVGIDLSPNVETTFDSDAWRGVVGDVGDPVIVQSAVETAVRDFGGLDILIVAAGIFPASQPIAELDEAVWERAFRVNTTAVALALQHTHPYLTLAPRGGRVVLISTKNVAAPGPGVAAYSSSKAAASQLARIAALEWATDGIRVNQVEPDAVFDTSIWTPELLNARAANYGLSVEEYKARNLLQVEVTSAAVAEAVLVFCEKLPVTTGAHLSVDGGNDRVI